MKLTSLIAAIMAASIATLSVAGPVQSIDQRGLSGQIAQAGKLTPRTPQRKAGKQHVRKAKASTSKAQPAQAKRVSSRHIGKRGSAAVGAQKAQARKTIASAAKAKKTPTKHIAPRRAANTAKTTAVSKQKAQAGKTSIAATKLQKTQAKHRAQGHKSVQAKPVAHKAQGRRDHRRH